MQEDTLLQDQPLGHKLIKKGFRLYLFMFLTAPVGYIVKVLVSNTLSVEDVGIFYSVFGLMMLFSSYNDLWLTEALQYYLPKYWIHKEYDNYKTILYITIFAQLITGLLVALLLFFGADWLAIHHFRTPEAASVLKTLCWFFLWINFIQVAASVYTAFQDTLASSLVDFVRMYSLLIFTLGFWFTHTLTLNNYAFSRIIGIFLAMIFSIIRFKKKYGYTLEKGSFLPNKDLIHTQIRYAFWVFLGANVGTLFGQVDQQIIVHFLWSKSAGYYSNYSSLITMYSLVTWPLLALVFPVVTELVEKWDYKKFSFFQDLFYKYFSLFGISLGAFFTVLGPIIAVTFFGEKFLYSGILLSYIGPFLVFSILYVINYGIMAWLAKVKQRVVLLWIALLITIVLNMVCIVWLQWWLVGAIVSSAVTSLFLWLGSLYYITNFHRINFDWWFLIKNIVLILFLTLFLYIVSPHIFLLKDDIRMTNFGYLIGIGFVYYCIIALFNYKSVTALIGEVKRMKQGV